MGSASLLNLPPPLIPSLQVITKPRAGLSLVCNGFPLAFCVTHNRVSMSVLLLKFKLPSSSPSMSTCPLSTVASPFLPCKEVHRYRFSGLCVYVLICGICFSPSDFMLYDRLWVLLHHCRWPSFFPFSGWILCYINVPHLLYCFLCQWTSRLISCSTMCVSLYSLMLW